MKTIRWPAIIHMLFAILLLADFARADWTDNWTFNGIRLSEVVDATWAERGVMTLGVATAYGVHFAGHALYLESEGLDWHMDGLSEMVDSTMSNHQKRNMGHAGFLSSNAVGWVAKLFGCDGRFWRGYYTGTAFETITYPAWSGIVGESDLDMIDDGGGNGTLAWALYSVSSAGLLVVQKTNKNGVCLQ